MDVVFQLFEGECPTCGAEVKITRVGGVPDFHKDFTFIGDHEVKVWETSPECYERGEVAFECTNGHKHSAFGTVGGDWVA